MQIVFRADASLQIGTGHVMRCLTLADALRAKGAECHFICRAHTGNLIDHLREKGFTVHALPVVSSKETCAAKTEPVHGHWLGASQEEDSVASIDFMKQLHTKWLVVDHYALDRKWEKELRPFCKNLLVIDDLADRPHENDLLLDQTFGRNEADYQQRVPAHCTILCGAQYALLRPEFSAMRQYSLNRRKQLKIENLLITLGGVDKDNVTTKILNALRDSTLPEHCQITVVMGKTAPWLEAVKITAMNMPVPTQVVANVSNMAELMANSDLAIGAAGATSWERCCLGLPTVMLVLADNQRLIAQALSDAGACIVKNVTSIQSQPLITPMLLEPQAFRAMINACAKVTDGSGTDRVVKHILNQVENAN